MDSADYMNYSAFFDNHGDYTFSSSMPESFEVPMLVAEMQIYQTSSITIQKAEGKFEVLATLNGKINVNAPLAEGKQSKGFKVDNLAFENMQVGSMAPHFKPGVWSLGEVGFSTMNGFSLSFENIESFERGDDVGLKFTTVVKLSGDKYVASTTLNILGTRYKTFVAGVERNKLKYKATELQDLYISINDAVISLEGYLAIYKDDPVYGNGYAGMIQAQIIEKIGVRVTAVFGEVNGFKYWYADALASFQASPIPIFTGVSMYGIGGGAYYHMSQEKKEGIPFASANINEARKIISYVPDESVFLGFKATLAIGASSPKSFNAMATFEIVFNSGGGIREAMFYGEGVLMSEMNLDGAPSDAPIRASVFIGMDFQNSTFHGSFKVYVNAMNGMLTGINPGNLAGEMVIHADPSDWYIHVGRPSARIGLKLSVFGLSIENGSYFMMGTKIEDMPPPPEEVMRILEMPVPDNRNDGDLMTAKGFAFGTYFNISTGDKNFGIFYASFDMGLGFDVMIAERGICQETGQPIGINGWYAEGQLYAFLEGEIGIDITVFRINIHEEILSIGAAILLETKLPNPFWMRGTVGGYYSLLGGRISGNCRFQLELGELCTIQSTGGEEVSPVAGLAVISELTPGDGRSNIDVFATPQVVFNYQVGKAFRISDDLQGGSQYRVVLDHFNVQAGGMDIIGNYAWNSRGDVLVFNPRDLLPGKTDIVLVAKVHFEEFSGTSWRTVRDGGQIITEEMTARFETGEAPDYIPEGNVLHNYPLYDMMNFYRNEFPEGHVQLNMGQPYLFEASDEWVQYGRFSPVAGGAPVYVEYAYKPGEKKITHIVPAALATNTVYLFELVNLPAKAASAIDANIKQQDVTAASESGDMTMVENVSETVRSDLQEKVIYTCYFRTSMFTSLSEKINSITATYATITSAGMSPRVFNMNAALALTEPFDKYEIAGHNGFEPLLDFYASTSCEWLENRQIPFIYADYPISHLAQITRRDTSVLGFVPVRDVYLDSYTVPLRVLNDEEKASGASVFTDAGTWIYYNLSPETYLDYQEIGGKLAMYPAIVHPRKVEMLTNPYPSLVFNSTYPVRIFYRLPYAEKQGTSNTINIVFD